MGKVTYFFFIFIKFMNFKAAETYTNVAVNSEGLSIFNSFTLMFGRSRMLTLLSKVCLFVFDDLRPCQHFFSHDVLLKEQHSASGESQTSDS